MALPTGSGSERLRRVTKIQNNTSSTILSGTALHIYTILSIIFQDQQNAANNIHISVHDGSSAIYLIAGQNVGPSETFIFNDRFVMEEDDDLIVYNGSTAGNWYVSYIDQDWT